MHIKGKQSYRGVKNNVLILLALALFVALALPGPVQADVIEVPCEFSATLALGQAIELANGNPGADTIRLENECTYGLFGTYGYDGGHNGLPVITDALTIEGNGARLERMGNLHFRLLKATAKLTIEDLTLANGYADDPNDELVKGGAIHTTNDLTLNDVTVINNVAPGSGAGVFASGGELTVRRGHFEANESLLDSGGGLYAREGEVFLYRTTFADNRAKKFGGGAYFFAAPAFVSESEFIGNSRNGVDGGGGALAVSGGQTTVFDSDFIDNAAPSGNGGAVYAWNGAELTVTNSRFEENRAQHGGAIQVLLGRITLLRSTFLLNNDDKSAGTLNLRMGDGTNSLIANNLIARSKSLTGLKTIEVSRGVNFTVEPSVTFYHNTIAHPTTSGATAIYIDSGKAQVVNNILAGHTYGLSNNNGSVSAGYNLYDVSNPANAQVGAIQPFQEGTVLVDDPLFVNQSTGNYWLQKGSPAIDAGYAVSVNTDIEGTARPQGDGYDLGAYEYVPQNTAPVAKNDSYTTQEDKALTVNAPGVLGNDEDVDGDDLTARLEILPQHGALALQANGGFTYTPDKGYVGQDAFSYSAYDGEEESNVATVSIEVEDVNEAPVAKNDSYSTLQDTALTVATPGVLDNDEDVDGDALTAVLQREPDHGSVTLNATGSFTYTPDNGYSGTDSFRYRARDGQADSNTATVTITVEEVDTNVPPVAVGDTYEVYEGATLTVAAPGVLGNDGDANGDALTAALASGVDHGQLTLNANGSFSYTPDAGYVGQDAFTYRASDGQENSNVATVTIEVRDVNEAPVAANDSYVALEDTALIVQAPGVLDNDEDGDDDALTAILEQEPAYGTVELSADGSFTYTPQSGYVGEDSFIYRAHDGEESSEEAIVTISVEAAGTNLPPVAVGDTYETEANVELAVPAPGVLGNDGDANGDALRAVLVSGPAYGQLALSADGSFTYAPDEDFAGEDSFTYQTDDGEYQSNEVTVRIRVLAEQAPEAPPTETLFLPVFVR